MFQADFGSYDVKLARGFAIMEHGTLEIPTDPTLQAFYSPGVDARHQFDCLSSEFYGTLRFGRGRIEAAARYENPKGVCLQCGRITYVCDDECGQCAPYVSRD